MKRVKEFFGKGKEKIRDTEWDWETFQTTKGYPISEKLLDWVIGQERALKECYLCLDEWVHKLTWLKEKKWWKFWEKPETEKPSAKDQLPAGPYLLLLGDAGTGKSLLGKALAEKLSDLYKKHEIDTFDVLCWKNRIIPSEPLITIKPAGEGRQSIIDQKKKVEKGSRLKGKAINLLCGFLITIGLGAIVLGFLTIFEYMFKYGYPFASSFGGALPAFIAGGSLLLGGFFIWWITKLGSNLGGATQGIGGASSSNAPKILIDNTAKTAPFIDATGHRSSQLFGDIAWDPYQTGGLGTPEHQRVSAGDVHRALMGILYIDEIKNLDGAEAITLLTVLEDGQLPITMRSRWNEGGTAAMAVSTQPVPCMAFFVGAGNFDSIPMIHPALMDRIVGYGKVVRMNNDMPDTIENRRKYIQFIAQETTRFHMPPFNREAAIELIDEARKRSGKAKALTTKFRPLIAIIKTAATLALNENKDLVELKHVKEAIEEHCKTIQAQLLEHHVQEENKYRDIHPDSPPKIGQIYGLAVMTEETSGDMAGSVLAIKASMVKPKEKKQEGYFSVTGINKGGGITGLATWVTDSVDKVRHVIIQKFGFDPAQNYMTHIDFAQELGVDGPSAGITMTLALCSILMKKKLRQDTAVTGEINIGVDGKILVTPVGGIYYKIKAAEAWGFKRVIVPTKNFEHNVVPSDYSIEVIGCETLDDYLREMLISD
jgi:Lon-like ATP-dependent protease